MRAAIRMALRLLGAQLGMAVAVVVAVGLLSDRAGSSTWSWVLAAAGGLVILLVPVTEQAASLDPLHVVQLPGHTEPRPLPSVRSIRIAGGVYVAALVLVTVLWGAWAGLVLIVLGGGAQLLIIGSGTLRRRRRGAERSAVRAALEAYGPQFVLYTGRRNDATYQLTMWLPLLEKLEVPYVVVVRDGEAVDRAARVTDAPVISCPNASDLDCVVVGSLKAAFYVNMIAENTSFVLYRSMTHVYLGHGDSDKELSGHPAHAMFDQIFVAGPAARERYPRNGVLIGDEKFVVVGRPQLAGVQTAVRPIGRAPVPTVLLAPTWRGYNSRTTLSSLASATTLADALISHGAAVVFRPHPFSWQGSASRAQITAVDDRLRADRAATGRSHVLACEQRSRSVAEVFDLSDALVTDVGSLLVDYFVTQKPYAVVLPPDLSPDAARVRFPTLEAAYLVQPDALSAPGRDSSGWLDALLGSDPWADRRPRVSQHYLGDRPGEDGPFLQAVDRILHGPQ